MTMSSVEFVAGIVLPTLAIAFVSAVVIANFFLSVRKRFPVRVNCWFCNTNSKVPYNDSNSWVCVNCTQYNGFTEDGDYNREIPAQYQSRLNPHANITDDDKISYTAPYNGLCFGCNRNQELKIHQLASFVPEVEENFEEEVEEYQQQLEQAYKLCSRCERVLKRTLNDVKRNILGSKLAQIGTKGLKVFDVHMKSNEKHYTFRKRRLIANICLAAIIALLLIKVTRCITQIDFTRESLEALFSSELSQIILIIISYLMALKHTMLAQWNGIMKNSIITESVNQLKCVKEMVFEPWFSKLEFSSVITEALREDIPPVVETRHQTSLVNMALICLVGMLMTLKSHIHNAKLALLAVCVGAEIFLSTDYGLQLLGGAPPLIVELSLATTSLLAAISCIGHTAPKIQPSDDLNSSFHKIYSQQASECDFSDTYEDSSSMAYNGSTASQMEYQQQQQNSSNRSRKSLDTTKSISPSTMTYSAMRPFLDSSFRSMTASPMPQFSTSALSINRLNNSTTFQEQKAVGLTRRSLATPTPQDSLIRTPSYSVDNFTEALPTLGRLSTTHGMSKCGVSMNALHSYNHLEKQFGEDIDRLSISDRKSVSRRDLTLINNPFAMHHIEPAASQGLLRQRHFNVSPPQLGTTAEPSSWIAGGYWGSPQKNPGHNEPATGGPTLIHPFMSRTSSQSSGFESQPTRRPTPEEQQQQQQLGSEFDRVSMFSEPATGFPSNVSNGSGFQHTTYTRLNQTFNIPPPSDHDSSFLGRPIHSPKPCRSLFGERNLFLQCSGTSNLSRPSDSLSMISRAANSSPHSFFKNRSNCVFPPQQSQTAVFGTPANLFQTGFPHLRPPLSNVGGPKEPENLCRRSLLNLDKLHETVDEALACPPEYRVTGAG